MPTQSSKKNRIFLLLLLLMLSTGFLILGDVMSGPSEITVSEGPVLGDVNGDGRTNLLDFQMLSDSLGKSAGESGYNKNADLNGDDKVDLSDFHILRRNYGRSGATHTPVVEPTATVNFTPFLSPTASPQPVAAGEMWITERELMSLPTSGDAWEVMSAAAYDGWGRANLRNQDNKHAINTLAGALVYARTGEESLRTKVRDEILAAKQSLDEPAEWNTDNGVLAAGRQLGAYVISADLIDLGEFDPSADEEFRSWLRSIRTTNIGTHGRWTSITYTCENAPANWGTFACASRIAASIYLGDTADVNRAANIIRAFLGDRAAYPPDAPGKDGYFEHTGGYDPSWVCDDATWTGINPGCVKSGVNLDGVLVEDAARGGGCCTLKRSGVGYSWEALQGLFVSVELLYRTGAYGDPYQWSNQALRRAMDFMQRSGWEISRPASYVPWIANFRYGTDYPAGPSSNGRIFSWGDWMYQ